MSNVTLKGRIEDSILRRDAVQISYKATSGDLVAGSNWAFVVRKEEILEEYFKPETFKTGNTIETTLSRLPPGEEILSLKINGSPILKNDIGLQSTPRVRIADDFGAIRRGMEKLGQKAPAP